MQQRAATPYAKHYRQREESVQQRVATYIKRNYPQVIFVTDFAAGLNLTDNQRIRMVHMRSEDGHPDISLDYPSRGYHGLRIELKQEGTVIYNRDGSLRKQKYTRRFKKNGRNYIRTGDHLAEQAATLQKYNDLGYFARFAIGFDKAIQLIDWYMEKPVNAELF